MPVPNQGQEVASFWETLMTEVPVDQIMTSQALTFLLKSKGQEADGGRMFEVDIEYATNNTFRSQGEMDPLDTTRVDVFDCARYDQKIFAGTVIVSDLEELRNRPAGRKFDLVKAKLSNGTNSAMELLDYMLFGDGTGNGGKDFDGLAKLVSSTPTTGTVGGINAATFAFWRNRQNSGAKTSSLYDNLVSALTTTWNQCTLGGTERIPTGVISDRDTFGGYEGRLVQAERLVRDSSGVAKGDLAFLADAIAFKGKPYIYDEQATANTAYVLNNNYIKLTYLKGGWMTMRGPVRPANQLINAHAVMTVGNLIAHARRHLGVVTSTAS